MIKVSVLYPSSSDARFDIEYYCQRHMPMVRDKLGGALKGVAVEKGVAGGAPGSTAPFVAIGHLYFESVDAFQQAFGPHAKAIMADIPNYTNVTPVIQVGQVMINAGDDEVGELHLHRPNAG